MNSVPCGNLVEHYKGGSCALEDREFPTDCPGCTRYVKGLTDQERQRCEVWSRVMGYHRPVDAWNAGKQQEHRDRVQFQQPRVQFLEGAGHD